MDKNNAMGVLWLAERFGVKLYHKPYVISEIGKSRTTIKDGAYTREIYPARSRLSDDVIAHLNFYLKNEIISLEFLARLFNKMDGQIIQNWINDEPTGRYARKAAFLYEWLTDKSLTVPSSIGGSYVDVLDDKKVVVADNPIKDNRWRVNNNIAGTKNFAPLVVKTETLIETQVFDIKGELKRLNDEFGEDLLMRASVWITLRESRASFVIEGEGNQESRIERFARVMAEEVGEGVLPLTENALARLQQAIIGKSLTIKNFGLRQSPVFVGESNYREAKEVVHYIAPHQDGVADKLQGLQAFFEMTKGQSSIIRSAVVAFGFVYIHPLADGNGRIHRLLINDVLRRDGQTDKPVILPISKAIIENGASKRAYNEVLDSISKPIMNSLDERYSFDKIHTYPDGVKSNLAVKETADTKSLWRFMDFTPHTLYLAALIKQVVLEDMAEESVYLRQYDEIREKAKEVIEMNNFDADRIIRSILDNKGVKSNKLIKEYELLVDDELWEKMVAAVKDVVGDGFMIKAG